MQKQKIKSYYVLYKENELYEKLKNENNLNNVIIINESILNNHENNFELFNAIYSKLPKTKAIITSFGNLNQTMNKFFKRNKHIKYICTTHGSIFLKTFVLKSNYMNSNTYNQLLAVNELEKNIDVKYGGFASENIPVIGLPRWDKLKKLHHKQKTIFMMYTWRTSFGSSYAERYGLPLRLTKYYKGIQSLINDSRFNDLLKNHNVKLIYTLHHSMLNQVDNPEASKFSNIEYVPCEKISKYIKKSDLFITDYSSLFFDFAFLNIPIVFYRPDFDDTTLLKLDREDMIHAKSMDKYLANICYDKDSAIDTIEKYILNNFVLEKEVQEKYKKLFKHKDNITSKFINYLEK